MCTYRLPPDSIHGFQILVTTSEVLSITVCSCFVSQKYERVAFGFSIWTDVKGVEIGFCFYFQFFNKDFKTVSHFFKPPV